MPQSTAPQPPTLPTNRAQSALMEGLSPALRSTLSSLNINLDYELARYRHAKRGEAPPGKMQPQFHARRQSLNLIEVPPATAPPPQVTPATAAVPPAHSQRIESPPGMTPPPSEVAALRSAIVQQSAMSPETYLASSTALLENVDAPAASPQDDLSAEPAPRSWTSSVLTPLGLGALMLVLVASAGMGFLLVNPSAASEFFQGTPLARFFPGEAEDADPDAIADGDADAAPEPAAEFDGPPLTSLSPDLSQREFADLDLNNLSTLPSNSTALSPETEALTTGDAEAAADSARDRETAEAAREPAAAPAAPTSAAPPNEPQRVSQMPTRTTPAPQPAAPINAAPAPAPPVAPPPSSTPAAETPTQPAPPSVSPTTTTSQEPISTYYVVTDYTGDPSLDAARSAVGDAYVRNFDMGARIQMGAFDTSEGAAALAEELRNQGIEAEIYEP